MEKNKKNALTKREKFAQASFILGIVAVCTCWIYGLGIIPGIVGLILGIMGRKAPDKKYARRAKIGFILSIVGIAAGVTALVLEVVYDVVNLWIYAGHPTGA